MRKSHAWVIMMRIRFGYEPKYSQKASQIDTYIPTIIYLFMNMTSKSYGTRSYRVRRLRTPIIQLKIGLLAGGANSSNGHTFSRYRM
ncbi:hypothetical protein DPV78_011687 [Talaromyces pinophilus]|nr:hypothetical protein DPV78_011687 [Talaromyces pinophilus]